MKIQWEIRFHPKIAKQKELLSTSILQIWRLLVNDLKINGPAPGKHWHHYGKLQLKKNEDKRHCHLNKGRPTYVCCWEINKIEQYIEVYYVGTHENAPY